jgi:hypothetical protein
LLASFLFSFMFSPRGEEEEFRACWMKVVLLWIWRREVIPSWSLVSDQRSEVAEHSAETNHSIPLDITEVTANIRTCRSLRVREAIEVTESHHNFKSLRRIQNVHGGGGGARGSVDDWGTVLETGRSRVRFPLTSLDISIDLTLPAALWPWGLTQPLTEMSTRNLSRGKGRPARKADNHTASCEPTV